MKRFLAVGAVSVALSAALGLGSMGSAGGGDAGDDGAAETPAGTDEDQGPHGGRIERFHAAGACDLVSTAGLPNNWTHGDYVTAVDAVGGAQLVTQAAHSDCGKPAHAVGHGGGPPAHALEHAMSGKQHGASTGQGDEAS